MVVNVSGPTRQPAIYAVTGAVSALTIITVALRIVSRRLAKAPFWWDDWLIWFGAAIALVISAETIYGASIGLGVHGVDVPEGNEVTYFKILLSIMTLYQWSMSAIKASLLLFYYRLFKVDRFLRYSVYFGLAFIIGWGIAYFWALLFQCTPIAYFWDRSIPGGHCVDHDKVNNNSLSVSNAATNIFTDVICITAPLHVLWNLRLSHVKKSLLIFVFFLGGCDIVISIVRMVYLICGSTADVLWSNSLPALWTVIEINIGTVCACLPGLMPIVSKYVLSNRRSRTFSTQSPTLHNDTYQNSSSRTGVSSRAYHGRLSRDEWPVMQPTNSYDYATGSRQIDVYGVDGQDDLEAGDQKQSAVSDGTFFERQTGEYDSNRILVTSDVEQKVEREWE